MKKGYIYTMYKGADPSRGWRLTDPIFGKIPTMGACMPNIRRAVIKGDHIFAISGRAEGVQQYVVGGFEVDQKIDALSAYKKFPEYRQRQMPDGTLSGNVIVTAAGKQNKIDYHTNFENRLANYIIGRKPLIIDAPKAVERARQETVPMLSDLFKVKGNTPADIIGRWRRLDEGQIEQMLYWMNSVKKNSR